MAIPKFLKRVGNIITEVTLGINTSAGAGDADKAIITDATGRLDSSFMPVGFGAETQTATATEALAAGDFVNIYASSGTKVRKADATTNGKPANGFVLASVLNTGTATVYMISQSNTQRSGLTPGASYFLSTTPGAIVDDATAQGYTTGGNIIQYIGVASSATEIVFSNTTFFSA